MTTRAPDDLEVAGKSLWHAMHRDYDLSPSEVVVLHEAARCADELDRIAAALAKAELTVKGSTGQTVSHPLLDDVRKHRDVLGRLLASLKEVR